MPVSKSEIDKFLDRAYYFAQRSTIKSFSTGAVVVPQGAYSGRESIGGWSHDSLFTPVRYRSIHAEIHAILRTPQKASLEGAVIYIATIRNKSGNIGLAKPCDQCQAYLYEVGIAEAIFTVEGEEWDSLKIA